ncbi:mitochondrial genome maintenance MGM101-domain-containing protein [Earliella scabrosa]|nr:mitochondrial genome maintenance MGM101-domain-containing protein [Earliella scabrosa]
MLPRIAANLRASRILPRSSRTYATTARVTTTRTRSTVTKAPVKTPVAQASTTVGRGNPEIIEDLPSTAHEVDIPPDAYAAPPESVPSSSAIQHAATSSPGSFAAAEQADSTTISGSPSDPSHPDWSKSYFGLSTQPFPKEAAEVLMQPVDPADVEIKPDGLIYLPEIKYRRALNKAFGPGGWGLAPRSETNVGPRVVSREYALVCLGRLVGIARGEQEYFDPNGIPTATEACKSNALMRCCKDLGIASDLWDPRFIREFKAKYCVEVFVEDTRTKKKKKLWRRKDQPKFEYPFKET